VRDAVMIARLRRHSTHLQSSRYLVKEGLMTWTVPELGECRELGGMDGEKLPSMVESACVALR
jgi:hypothetical protein